MELWKASPASVSDAAEILALDRATFEHPWQHDAVLHELQRRGALGVVLRTANTSELIGYCLGWSLAGEAELLRIAVAVAWRRKQLGGVLLRRFLELAAQEDVESVFLEVSQTNVGALALYRGQGFAQVGRRAAYYLEDGVARDAIVMRCSPGR